MNIYLKQIRLYSRNQLIRNVLHIFLYLDIWPITPAAGVVAPTRLRYPVLAPEEQFWRPIFVKPKKIILIKRRGNSLKQKLLEMIQVTVGFILMNLFLFGFTKTKTGAKTAPRAPRLSSFDGRASQLSARVNHGTPATGVIGHIYTIIIYYWQKSNSLSV